jgi:hypothetical protein
MHTKGPWEVSFGKLDGNGEFSVYQGESGTICRGDNEMVAWEANARMIAACPQMYEALKWIAEQEQYTFTECTQAEEIISKAKNAIRAAEGGK